MEVKDKITFKVYQVYGMKEALTAEKDSNGKWVESLEPMFLIFDNGWNFYPAKDFYPVDL